MRTLFAIAVWLLAALAATTGPARADWPADRNVYLGSVFEWNPGSVGINRKSYEGMTDDSRKPIQNDRALGPPTGTGSFSSRFDSTCVGIRGSAAWQFEDGYYIYDGPGEDFITFQDSFAWNGTADGLCNELGHVEVSADGETWYYNAAASYIENPNPDASNGGYSYFDVHGLHGNNLTWANHLEDIQAQELQEVQFGNQTVSMWVNIPGVMISRDFTPADPHLGGNRFDLADFRSKTTHSSWPADGKMRYLRIIDDPAILDGQDYDKSWSLGTHLHAAMAIHAMLETAPGDRNGPFSIWTEETRTGIPDPGIPGYIGPDGDGRVTAANRLNPRFKGWATGHSDYRPADNAIEDWVPLAEEWQTPDKALGPATGDNFDIVSLGDMDQQQIDDWATDPQNNPGPGSVTFTFDIPITNGPGADFAVFENGFATLLFTAELAYVEVSTDGETFARFPSRFEAAQAPVGHYGTLDTTYIHNLAGKHANAYGFSWGTPFDLADLKDHPRVLDGSVDLHRINYVRIVDIPGSGDFTDTDGNAIYDAWPTAGSGGMDIEAVGVIHQAFSAFEALQINVGIAPPEPPNTRYDRDGDGRLGIAEAIFWLQKAAGAR